MRRPEEAFTGRALGGRHIVHQLASRRLQKLHGLRRDVAVEELFDFQNPETFHFQSDRDSLADSPR
jgi:hypothetical protein